MFTDHPERGEETYEIESFHKAMETFNHMVIMAYQHAEYNRAEIRSKNRDGSFRVLVAFDHNGLPLHETISGEEIEQACKLPDELPDFILKECKGKISEQTYRLMREEHFRGAEHQVREFYDGSWLRYISAWLYTSSQFDPPYGSKHHVEGFLADVAARLAEKELNHGQD
jgi:hypothetical protein